MITLLIFADVHDGIIMDLRSLSHLNIQLSTPESGNIEIRSICGLAQPFTLLQTLEGVFIKDGHNKRKVVYVCALPNHHFLSIDEAGRGISWKITGSYGLASVRVERIG